MGEIHPVIKRFYEATNKSSISDLAESLGIRRQAVYSAVKSGVFPKDWYFKVAEMTDCSMDWLVHGIGPKKRVRLDNPSAANVPEAIDLMINFLFGGSEDSYEKNRCTIQICQTLESKQEEVKSSLREEKKKAIISNLKQFASKVSIGQSA